MSKNQKLLIAAVLLIVFAAAKLLLLDWWQQQQSKTKVVECNLIQGCVLPDGSKVRATSINAHEPFDIVIENVPQNTGAVSISFSMKTWTWASTAIIWRNDLRKAGRLCKSACRFVSRAAMITLPILPSANRLFRRHLARSSHPIEAV